MNKALRPTVFLALSFLTMTGAAALAAPAPMPHERTTMSLAKARIHIPSMTCSNRSCATTVYLSLIRLPGVMGVGVDESNQNVTVKYIPSKTRPAVFLRAVRNAGYPGVLVTRKKT
ncbi:MAG: heavy-metal-associated domain-containing protein [Acidiferrobacteraceae bacterium]